MDSSYWQALHHWRDCIKHDRPFKLSFDAENLLHADAEPALQFADGYSVFANHGQPPFINW